MIIAIIQARMGSKRLPGKVLMRVNEKPLLSYQLDRISKSKKIDFVVVATSTLKKDNEIEFFCKDYGVDCYRGSENDVLKRYFECASKYNPSTIVRMTADCPLIDPEIIDKVIQQFQDDQVDFCANTVPPKTSKFPDGSDVEVFSMKALKKANEEIKNVHFREHVTFQFWQDTNYTSSQLTQVANWSNYRITLDYPEDFEVINYIFKKLSNQSNLASLEDIINIIDKNQVIKEKNSLYHFGQGWNL